MFILLQLQIQWHNSVFNFFANDVADFSEMYTHIWWMEMHSAIWLLFHSLKSYESEMSWVLWDLYSAFLQRIQDYEWHTFCTIWLGWTLADAQCKLPLLWVLPLDVEELAATEHDQHKKYVNTRGEKYYEVNVNYTRLNHYRY